MTAPGPLRIGPQTAELIVRTRREGLAAKVGHDLTLRVRSWQAEFTHPEDPASGQVTATIDLSTLTVVEGSGGAMPLAAAERVEIEGNIRKILGAGTATFASTRLQPDGDGGAIEGNLTLNGVTRPLHLRVRKESGDRYRATATVVQTAYNVKPYSAFFGALKLRDEVEVDVLYSERA
jgi:polyisoprenoid-binding protein YceI